MKRLLIVDDDTSVFEPLSEILEGLYELDFASSGLEALERLEARRPDAMLLDIRMDGLNGLELLDQHAEELRAEPPIKIVIYTSLSRVAKEWDSFYETWQARDLVAGALDKAQAVEPDFVDRLKGLLGKAMR